VLEATFLLSLVFVAYTYFGYPLLIWLLAKTKPEVQAVPETPADWPAVTVIMSVYNEADRIEAKLKNLRELDYPSDKLFVVVINDGSDDHSAQVLAQYDYVHCIAHVNRQGKPPSLNDGVSAATTPLIAMMDVRQTVAPDALKKLVTVLLSPQNHGRAIGAVSGELVHIEPGSQTAASIGLYWRYEKMIRKSESRWDSTVGTTGACYLLRKEDFMPLPADTLLDDFVIPMHISRRGKRVLLHDGVPVYDELQKEVSGERKRKIRTLSGNFQAFFRYPWMFVPGANRLWFELLSHKVFRLLVPYALIAMLVSSFLLRNSHWFFMLCLTGQLIFYLVGALGPKVSVLKQNKLVSVSGVFVELNWAAVQGFWRYCTSSSDSKWEKT
jgi:poly-beta-1,6-N-acetyl-D-glucosamine synthase